MVENPYESPNTSQGGKPEEEEDSPTRVVLKALLIVLALIAAFSIFAIISYRYLVVS